MTNYESFWTLDSFAFVGNTAKKPFPAMSYAALKKKGKTVIPVDPSVDAIQGDSTYRDLESLPEAVQGVVIEVPREETKDWVEQAAAQGIRHVWIHMGRETPEALELARDKDINVRSGTCAVMYLQGGYHSIHKWINKALGKY